MQKIINLAKRKRSVACIIVKDNKIIAQAITTIFTEYQPFRHAEINTIEKACKKLKTFDLKNCWLYTTYEPCPMCASAIVWANIKGVVYGASMKDRNKVYTQKILIPCKTVLKHGTPKVKLYEKFMEKECKKLLLL
jgi:tRNA(Arg) A34 adenosine deaminase TadA